MHLKSILPDIPAFPDMNVHIAFFKRPDQAAWKDFKLFIDLATGEEYQYKEFVESMYDAATALGAPISAGGLGLRSEDGEIVGIMCDNYVEFPLLIHACLAITTPFTMISASSTAFELKYLLEVSKATRLFVQEKYLSLVLQVTKEVGLASEKIYVLGRSTTGRLTLSDMIKGVRSKSIPREAVRPAKKDTLAYLIFSSGTGGLPKAIMISHGNLMFTISQEMVVNQVDQKAENSPVAETIPYFLGCLPMHHSYGFTGYCIRPLLLPSTVVFMPRWDLDEVLKLIPKYKIKTLDLIPSVVPKMLEHPDIDKVDFSSVQRVNSGAAHLPSEMAANLKKYIPQNTDLRVGYGLSEATVRAIVQPTHGSLGGRLKRIQESNGILLPNMECRILREDGSEADYNEPGELWLKGGNISLGYWNNPEATKETFVDGWLRTGDMFKADPEGNLYYIDRVKDTLKVSGSQVSPKEIETVLFAHPKKLISDCSVAGVSGGRAVDEKVPRAWVVLSSVGNELGPEAVIKELDRWHKENLSKYKWLRGGIEVIDQIPKNPTGKTLRRVLQEKYARDVALKEKVKL